MLVANGYQLKASPMSNNYFQFKQFTIHQDKCAMNVTTDGCLFGAWAAGIIKNEEPARPAGGSIINNCLEIGTGTGLLALMVAQQHKLIIDTIEIDDEAARQAKENVATSPWHDRINVINEDAREFAYNNKYDVIISNPPFYENELKAPDAKKNMAHHSEGLLLPELLSIIKQQLKPAGSFYLLLPYKREEEIRNLFLAQDFAISQMALIRQSVDHSYFRIMLQGKLASDEPVGTMIEEIAIKDDKGNYTPAFTNLLKDYYLHL
jgi:tRNA1Val (adenine37-N6)-methyltransferase